MEDTAVQKKFEIKKWNAVALWAWGMLLFNISPKLVAFLLL